MRAKDPNPRDRLGGRLFPWALATTTLCVSAAWAFSSGPLQAPTTNAVRTLSGAQSPSSWFPRLGAQGPSALVADGSGTSQAGASANVVGEPATQPMTTVNTTTMAGYFEDPVNVRLAPSAGNTRLVFSGTTTATMACSYPVTAQCFTWTKLTVDAGSLASQITAAGAHVTNYQNIDAFQADDGSWHAVVAIGVASTAQPDHWTVLVHAHPSGGGGGGPMPLAWSADTVLSGSFSQRVDGNYDGKYYQEGNQLYLLYVKNFAPKPALRNGIVIQPMVSPTQVSSTGPTTLLTTGLTSGPLVSENYAATQAKLVEAPYIVKMAGKYALLYATGAYREADYKTGVAWSDTLLPAAGGRYRKVLQPDPQNVWGSGPDEVRYLLQSQKSNWPAYTANSVWSPGVPSAALSPTSVWTMYFAGYDPTDRPFLSPGVADPKRRRPYFVRMTVSIPAGQTVANATDAQMTTWLQAQVR